MNQEHLLQCWLECLKGYTDEEVQKAVGIFSNSNNNEHSNELYDIIEKLLDRIENLEKRLGVKA